MPKRNALLCALIISLIASTRGGARDLPDLYSETITAESGEQISFEMKLIPGSTFFMGSPDEEDGRDEDEGPRYEVRLSPYYLAAKETTLELFLVYYRETHAPADELFPGKIEEVDAVTGPTPVYGDLTMGRGGRHPAIGMTWENAVSFCKWLSIKTGKEYRLPTEAEWENACRCGVDQTFSFGNATELLAEYAWYEGSASDGTAEVGTRKPNSLGLYDMHGNVCEWVHDFYTPEGYLEAAKSNPSFNPQGPEEGKVHVTRGGYYRSPAKALRCASRDYERRWWRSGDPQLPKSKWWLPDMDHIGFRVARSAGSQD